MRQLIRVFAVIGILVPVGALVPASTTHAAGAIVFDGSVGTAAPPPTLGGYRMLSFPPDPTPLFSHEASLPTPAGGLLQFAPTLLHYGIGTDKGWLTWSHGYTGDVYVPEGNATQITIALPSSTGAFYLYADPNRQAPEPMGVKATGTDSTTFSTTMTVNGADGASFFGLYGTGGVTLTSVTVSCPEDCVGFAIGEFGIATVPPTAVQPGPAVQVIPYLYGTSRSLSAGFFVTFPSKAPGQGYLLFGPGPGCTGLIATATGDVGAGTTSHSINVTGDDMQLGTGAVLPGATYSFEVETVSASGVEIDTNGGKCYSVTIPSG